MSVRPWNSIRAKPSSMPYTSANAIFRAAVPAPPVYSRVLSISKRTRPFIALRIADKASGREALSSSTGISLVLLLDRPAGLSPGLRAALDVKQPCEAGGCRHLRGERAALSRRADEQQILVLR